jgi:hypothetical protein
VVHKIKVLQVATVLYGLKIVFITGDQCPVPVFDFSFLESSISYSSKTTQYLLNFNTHLSSFFFNKDLGIWEPFIEPLFVQFDHGFNENGNPQMYSNIEFNQNETYPCNINLTVPILHKFSNLITAW